MFTLRSAVVGDAPAIRALIRKVRINPIGLNWQHFVLAVIPAGQMIGCGQVKPHRDGSLELASIAVEPQYRSQGIARAIIQELLAENPSQLYLTCRSSLQSFYEQFGFQVISFVDMPSYFKRVTRLSQVILLVFANAESLLVMRRTNN
jgi:N-acetylglutamate synthase-like GNAT family acetyltransferase